MFRSCLLPVALAALAAQPAAAQSAAEIEALILGDHPDANLRVQALIEPLARDRTKLEALLAQTGFRKDPDPWSDGCDGFYYSAKKGADGLEHGSTIALCGEKIGIVMVMRGFLTGPRTTPSPGDPHATTIPAIPTDNY